MKKIMIASILVLVLVVVNGIVLAQIDGYKMTALEVKGNENISSQEILNKVEIEVGEKLTEEQLQKDLQSVYDLGYFQSVQPDVVNYKDGVKVIIEIEEHPVLKEVDFKGTQVFDKAQMLDWLGLEIGKVINMEKLRNGIGKLEQEYQSHGYIPTNQFPGGYHYVDFDDINVNQQGKITIPINVGYLNEIKFEGNEKTKDFVIRREFDLNKGEVLRIEEIQKSLQSLYKLNFFEEINPQPLQRVENSNKVNLIVNLVERKTGTLNFGGGYSSKNGWIGLFNIKEQNLLGYGQSLSFEWEFGGTNNLSLNFQEPSLFSTKTSFGISFYDNTVDRKIEENEYTEKKQGGSISLGYPIVDTWRGSLIAKMEDYKKTSHEDSSDIETGKTRSLTLEAKQDTTIHPFNPTTGVVNNLSLEYAGAIFGGDHDFTKYNFDLRKYVPGFREEHAWAFRVKGGISNGNLPTLEEYRLGGSQSLRGYEDFSFLGKNMLLLNLEYRLPLDDKFTGVAFVDGGNTWESLEAVQLDQLHYSAGVGVRMNTPIGQLRLDYGWNENGNAMPHFSIGQTF